VPDQEYLVWQRPAGKPARGSVGKTGWHLNN